MYHKLIHHPVMAHLRKPSCAACGMLILRLAAGAVFLYHGWPKLFSADISGMAAYFGSIGIPAPAFMVRWVGFFEVFGGLGLILGFASRFWAAALAIDMIVAILAAKGLASWKAIELEAMLLASMFAVFLSGAGRWSLDARVMEKAKGEHAASLPSPGAGG